MQQVLTHCGRCSPTAAGAYPLRQVLTLCGRCLPSAAGAYSLRQVFTHCGRCLPGAAGAYIVWQVLTLCCRILPSEAGAYPCSRCLPIEWPSPKPLVTWHQSKNPQDGSCGTDCPHALPRSKPVVIRLDFSCVFPVSGRAHPARQPSRTPPWARDAVLWGTDAHTWPPPDRQTPTWRLPRQLCADMARAQWQGTIVVPRTYRCAVVARPSGQSAVAARPSRQSAAAAPPKQSNANVAPLQ